MGKELKLFEVSMEWTTRGWARVYALGPEEAVAKCGQLKCRLDQTGVQFLDWKVLDKPRVVQ